MPKDAGPAGSERIPAPQLRSHLVRALRDGVAGSAFADDVRVEYVPNWGGFVNASFRVVRSGGDVRVKLAWERDAIAGLRRWERLAPTLAERHHAPRMLGWLRIPGTTYEGAIFPWVKGAVPSRRDRTLIARVGAVIDRLRTDADLAARLRPLDPPRTCRDVYLQTLDERSRENLRILDAVVPPFVVAADVAWMRDEVEELARLVSASPAFDEEADAPFHGDLWTDNLLLADDGRIVVLDWDGIALGDAVFDWATFLGPMRGDYRLARLDDVPTSRAWSDASKARFGLYARAGLLDWVVDGLADWLDAVAGLGDDSADVRSLKQTSVEDALRSYRTAFCGR